MSTSHDERKRWMAKHKRDAHLASEPKYGDGDGEICPVCKSLVGEAEILRPLVVELRTALALERGGGTPLSREEYIDLNNRAREAINGS